MMNQKYIDEIRAREQAATPGEWYITTNDAGGFSIFTTINGKTYKIGETFVDDDARLAAHARIDIPALVAEVERLMDENVTLKKALKLACSDAADPDCPMTESLDLENPVKSCDDCQGECGAECWKRYYIQQAKEQEANHAE